MCWGTVVSLQSCSEQLLSSLLAVRPLGYVMLVVLNFLCWYAMLLYVTVHTLQVPQGLVL